MLIPGRMTHPDEKKYSFYDWAPAGAFQYKLESVGVSGVKETYEQFAGPVVLDRIAELGGAGDVDTASMAAASDSLAVSASVKRGEVVGAAFAAMTQSQIGFRKADAREFQAPGAAKVNEPADAAIRNLAASEVSAVNPAAGARWFSSNAVSGSSFSAAKGPRSPS